MSGELKEPTIDEWEQSWHNRPIAGHAFVQWKGTNVCMDLTCPKCKSSGHVDGYFAYHVKCSACGAVFAMNVFVAFHEVRPDDDLEPDSGNTQEF